MSSAYVNNSYGNQGSGSRAVINRNSLKDFDSTTGCFIVLCLLVIITIRTVYKYFFPDHYLSSKWVLYYSPDCKYCKQQKSDLDYANVHCKKVNCKTKAGKCNSKGITSFPTWLNETTNQVHVGYIPLREFDDLLPVLSKAPLWKN